MRIQRRAALHGLAGLGLNAETRKILAMPDVQDKLGNQSGMEIVGSTPEELAANMARGIPRCTALVKKSGATAN